jgi:hypothetical protein
LDNKINGFERIKRVPAEYKGIAGNLSRNQREVYGGPA